MSRRCDETEHFLTPTQCIPYKQYCDAYPVWMNSNCPGTCGISPPPPPPPPASKNCQLWDTQCRQKQANTVVNNTPIAASTQKIKADYFYDNNAKYMCDWRKNNGSCWIVDRTTPNEPCKKTCLQAGIEPPNSPNNFDINVYQDMLKTQNNIMYGRK